MGKLHLRKLYLRKTRSTGKDRFTNKKNTLVLFSSWTWRKKTKLTNIFKSYLKKLKIEKFFYINKTWPTKTFKVLIPGDAFHAFLWHLSLKLHLKTKITSLRLKKYNAIFYFSVVNNVRNCQLLSSYPHQKFTFLYFEPLTLSIPQIWFHANNM